MFEVGEKVVCVNTDEMPSLNGLTDNMYIYDLELGATYTVRYVGPCIVDGVTVITLWELEDYRNSGKGSPLRASRFRKLRKLETKTALKALVGLTDKTSEQVR